MVGYDINSILVAVTSLIVSVVTAFVTYLFTKKRDIEINKNQKEIEELKSKLDKEKSERDARQDYEYDAKKRIYQKFEPLLFQFNELGENTLKRVKAFAREARNNYLDEWLSDTSGYYFKNSVYRIFAPLSVFKLMQEELTLFDLNLEPKIKNQYVMIKSISHFLSHDFKFADVEPKPKDKYDPHSKYPSNITNKSGRRTQGIVQGRLDQIIEIFIIQENSNNNPRRRVISYGEFENLYPEIRKSGKLDIVVELFSDFHPARKPILWRILLAQAILYNSIIDINSKPSGSNILNYIKWYTYEKQFEFFDWRNEDEMKLISDEDVDEPFRAIKNYFENNENLKMLMNG